MFQDARGWALTLSGRRSDRAPARGVPIGGPRQRDGEPGKEQERRLQRRQDLYCSARHIGRVHLDGIFAAVRKYGGRNADRDRRSVQTDKVFFENTDVHLLAEVTWR